MDFISRMKLEAIELAEKLNNLELFIKYSDIYQQLDANKQELLNKQKVAMKEYYSILKKRIELE